MTCWVRRACASETAQGLACAFYLNLGGAMLGLPVKRAAKPMNTNNSNGTLMLGALAALLLLAAPATASVQPTAQAPVSTNSCNNYGIIVVVGSYECDAGVQYCDQGSGAGAGAGAGGAGGADAGAQASAGTSCSNSKCAAPSLGGATGAQGPAGTPLVQSGSPTLRSDGQTAATIPPADEQSEGGEDGCDPRSVVA